MTPLYLRRQSQTLLVRLLCPEKHSPTPEAIVQDTLV